jgi:PKD repeat protein
MKTANLLINSLYRLGVVVITIAMFFGAHQTFAQSIGLHVVTNSVGGIDNAEGDSLLPDELAGVPSLTPTLSGVQSNWNNISSSGSGTFTLTNSLGTANTFVLQWASGYSDTTGTWPGLGTPDGKLMDAFLTTWGPGAATPLGSSVSSAPINDRPVVYISGLSNWWTGIPNAEGYAVVLYTTGNSYWETAEGYLESVTGSPTNNTMVEGSDLTPHYYEQDTSVFTGTYIPTTSTSLNSPTAGANYMFFNGLTNDAILIRLQCHGYGAGLNAFQFIPVFPTPATALSPTIAPSSEVYAGVPVTITAAATGDPFHTNLWYQWYSDNASGGAAFTALVNETNSTYTVVPTNNPTTYAIQYYVVVTNVFGASTSSVVTLTVDPASAPTVTQDTTPGPGNGLSTVYAYQGGSISFTVTFGGTPADYLWESNSIGIPGATNTTLTLNKLPLSATASYDCTATNGVGGISSTPASLVVLADPPAPDASEAYAYDVFTNNPIAYWRFSETQDNTANFLQAYDYSGHGNNAIYGTAAYDNQPGPQSPQFAGFESTNNCVSLVNNVSGSDLIAPSLNLNTNNVTITAWINPSGAIGANWGLLTWANGNDKAGFGFGGNVSNGVAELGYVWNSNSPSTYGFHSNLYPPLGQWSFVALVITPTNSTIYLYYVDQNSGTTNLLKAVQANANQMESFSGGTTWIGSDSYAGRNFNGSMDELAVFNQSLSQAQVQDLFDKALGVAGIPPAVSSLSVYPAASVYSGQNVRLTPGVTGTDPLLFQWQSSSDGSTWSDIPGATNSTLLANPQTVGTIYYRLIASNPVGSATNSAVVTFNALPPTPPGLWTVNYQVTNNVLSYTTGAGVGHYTGRGILGNGSYWNVLPDNQGAFGYIWELDSASDLLDDGATHSGITCSVYGGCSGFGSATSVQPDSSDIGNLLYQWVTSYNTNNSLQFHGLPDGTYNLCLYGCDGSFSDRGTTFRVHGANGDQTAGTTNASPILPLQQDVNFVVITNVHAVGGTLNVDILPTPSVPQHATNTEADFNGVQLQLVSYDPPVAGFGGSPTHVFVNQSVTFTNTSTGATNWLWNFGDGNTLNTSSRGSVSHAYAAAGTYTVSQTATGPLGTASVTNTAYVVVSPRPTIGSVQVISGSLVLSGADGISGQQYRILTSTNVALPLASWTPVLTNVFDPDGSYGYTNSSPSSSAGFFILVSP